MYFNRQQEQNDALDPSPSWSDTYDNTPYDWATLDSNNKQAGYKSDFVGGSKVWDALANLVIAATVFIFVGFILFVQSIIFKVCEFRSRTCAAVLFLMAFIFWCIAWGLPTTTSQLDSKAWSQTFFQSCTVQIKKGPVYFYGAYVIAATGGFVIAEILLYLVMTYFDIDSSRQGKLELTAIPAQV
jgi:hypothetical protein